MLREHELLSEEDRDFISLLQENLIEALNGCKNQLSEEEIAYCLKVALDKEQIRMVIHNL